VQGNPGLQAGEGGLLGGFREAVHIPAAVQRGAGGGTAEHVPLNTYVELSDQLDAQDDGPQGKSPEELLIDRENMEKLKEEIWQLLSPMEKKILRSYLDGESYTETAS